MCGCGQQCWSWGHSPMFLLSLLLSTAPFALRGEDTRQVSLQVIPSWPDAPQNLLHVRAVGTNSTLHYVWGTLGPPAVVLVATNTPHSTLSVNWSHLLSPEPEGGLMVLPKDSIQFSSALVFTRVQAFSRSGRPAQSPRLLHTADTCQLEVTLVGASPRGNRSLFGLEVATLGGGPDCPLVQEQHSIDDEYAPAVFQLDQLLWGSLPTGFVQWRPVAYSQQLGGRESALPCHASPLHPTLAYSLPQSPIVRAFFGPQNNFCAFNMTFGTSTGPGYWDQRYLSWSMLVGVGSPPADALSPLVLGIMAVALGAPGLILLGGGLVLLLRHKRSSEYESIN
ncbi:glycosylated lysosomal membrane protein isoform X2 [Nycticebus coucang]|uniref:glycosylated lysosomal membrane protein isoform X2 n=1 Tax=Nycticebus coucang TaxID=9470 RepID=UPI00234DD061|nr:glycosylated lysosomal membrane protein isoform X2 [Nycticebus coucang]